MRRDLRDPERPTLADDQPKQAVATWRVTDPLSVLRVDAGRHEALDDASGVDDAERGVARPDQVANPIDDQLEGGIGVEDAGDRPGGRIEGGQVLAGLRQLDLRLEQLGRGGLVGHAPKATSGSRAGGPAGLSESGRLAAGRTGSRSHHRTMSDRDTPGTSACRLRAPVRLRRRWATCALPVGRAGGPR